MLKVKLTRYDGSSWNHCDLTLFFKNYKELEDYKSRAALSFDDIEINNIEEVNENENE